MSQFLIKWFSYIRDSTAFKMFPEKVSAPFDTIQKKLKYVPSKIYSGLKVFNFFRAVVVSLV